MTNAELVNLTERAKKVFNKTSVAPLETIRNRLQLSQGEFATALGYSEGAYSDWLRTGNAPQVAGLAAECLMRRQAPSTDRAWLTRDVKGALVSTPVDLSRTMSLDGKTYWLVESK